MTLMHGTDTSTSGDNTDLVRTTPVSNDTVPERGRHTWSLFADWCTAHDQSALPVSPELFVRFLRANPAAPATQRRRIAVIDAVHRDRALPPPGRGQSVRAALDALRAARLRDTATRIGGIVTRLPGTGWPAALFARRDALVLTLAAAGLPNTEIAALRIRDVAVEPEFDALTIETGTGVHAVTSLELVRAGASPRKVYRRWYEVLAHGERHPSTRMLADAIEHVDGTELADSVTHLDPGSERPLLTTIDRWGHTPLVATPLTSRGIADIVRAHLGGRAPTHIPPPVRETNPKRVFTLEPASAVSLDPGYYERGTLARRHSHALLDDVDSVLADVENRADRLLRELLEFLDAEMPECEQ